jgi:ABC-type antimicrobial peptide transport system permease subunit
VSAHFFDLFSWEFVKGNAATAIKDPYSIVLTESSARAFFGDEDPMGKVLRVNNRDNVKVSAVVKDPPGNSSITFDYVRLFNYNTPLLQRMMNDWNSSSWAVYIQPAPGVNMAQVKKIINDEVHAHDPGGTEFITFPMSRWRLYSDFENGKSVGGMIEEVRLFSIIAVIILLIACINFMNLSTARSEKRAREVGVRKTLGSGKTQLVWQFIMESQLLAVIAFVLSLALVFVLLPLFNDMVNKQLRLEFADPVFWGVALAIVLFTGIVAGSYPAWFLSSFNPVKVLKGTFLGGKAALWPRRVLVVAQFIVSILLISATIIVYRQLQFVKDRDLGYDPDNLIGVFSSPDLARNYENVRQELINTGLVSSVTRNFAPVTEIWWRAGNPDWEGRPQDLSFIVAVQSTGRDYIKTTGLRLLEGRDFSGMPADSSSIIINRATMEAMKVKDPLGRTLRFMGREYTIIGVTDNMVVEDPYRLVDPTLTVYDPGNANIITLRLNDGVSPKRALAAIEPVFKKANPQYPFEYRFVDEEFGRKFQSEELISRITDIFAVLAIFICCLGLAGLVAFTIEKRTKEIGVRKVLGASVAQLLQLVSAEFLRLVLVAFVIAVPLTWWMMGVWLKKYLFQVAISPWLFAAVGGAILVLTLAVVSSNTIGTALRNPVKSLRE